MANMLIQKELHSQKWMTVQVFTQTCSDSLVLINSKIASSYIYCWLVKYESSLELLQNRVLWLRLTMSHPFCFSRQRFCVIVFCPSCVHVSQLIETWSPVGQSVKVQLLLWVWGDRTERTGLWTDPFIVKHQKTIVRRSSGVIVCSV